MSRAELAAATGLNEVLAGSAFLFSNLWLDDVLSRAMDPVVPAMQNTDGEPLEFLTLHFAIDSQAKLPAIRAALDGLSALHKESETFWNWLERRGSGPRATPKSAAVHTFDTTMDDGSVVLGNIELGEKALTLSANSEARAARGRALLESALAGSVRAPLVERQTVEQMMDSSRGKGMGQDSLDLSWDEQRRLVHRALTDHYRRTLDDPSRLSATSHLARPPCAGSAQLSWAGHYMQTLPPSDDPNVSQAHPVPSDFLGRGAGAILIAKQRLHGGSDVRRHQGSSAPCARYQRQHAAPRAASARS